MQIQTADFKFISFHNYSKVLIMPSLKFINTTFCMTGLSREFRKKGHSEKQSKGICKCKVYPLSANKV